MQRQVSRSRKARKEASSSRISRPNQLSVSNDYTVSSKAMDPGFFFGAHDFIVSNSTLQVCHIQGDYDTATSVFEALAERTIEGSEHDSSARDPPPLCHPGTQVQLMRKINTWFHNKGRQKALLWLNGPAGVGKSAVIQTFAESLLDSQCLGATLFFSRHRNDSQRVVTTIALQLATRIPSYRAYIFERIAVDPSLLEKGTRGQFRAFIVEPFGVEGIGREEGPWGILLDGLDECEGADQQVQLVRLISEFVLNFPHGALVWVVGSRPEPHIVATFAEEMVTWSHWSEYMPVNSTEACQDVERFLNASFEAIRKRFSHVPPNWPTQAQFLTLTNGARGLFLFARTVVRFIEDADRADPISRLDLVLKLIGRAGIQVVFENPFSLLDALYTDLLASIPTSLWHTTKRILGFVICTQSDSDHDGLSYPLKIRSRNLIGASLILNLSPNLVYSSLDKLQSVLEIPPAEIAHKSEISFLHASFVDYLTDPIRSGCFYVDRGGTVDEITQCFHRLYVEKPWDTKWAQYITQITDRLAYNFFRKLRRDVEVNLYYIVTGVRRAARGLGPFNSQTDLSKCLDLLTQINAIDFFRNNVHEIIFTGWVFSFWNTFREDLEYWGLCREVALKDLKFDHLDVGINKPVAIFQSHGPMKPMERLSPDSPHTLLKFTAELRSLQLVYPEKRVLIFGSTPEKRNALIHFFGIGIDGPEGRYYCIPYPYYY